MLFYVHNFACMGDAALTTQTPHKINNLRSCFNKLCAFTTAIKFLFRQLMTIIIKVLYEKISKQK